MRLCRMETRLNQLWKPLLTQLMLSKARWNGSCNLASIRIYFFMPLATYPSSSFNTFLNWNVNKTVVKDTARKSAIGSAI